MIIWHIGGGSKDIGPAQAIIDAYPDTKLITFDAREGEMKCFSDWVGKHDFYVTKNPLASSMLKPDPSALKECTVWGYPDKQDVQWWRDTTELVRKERVDTTTVDAEVANGLPAPDVLSIDAQGAELKILYGAIEALPKVLAIVSEVEFWPIYKDQPVFGDQASFMKNWGFRLADMTQAEHWHVGEPVGFGFPTVSEATWLRFDMLDDLNATELSKLAMIAMALQRISFASHVAKLAEKRLCARS